MNLPGNSINIIDLTLVVTLKIQIFISKRIHVVCLYQDEIDSITVVKTPKDIPRASRNQYYKDELSESLKVHQKIRSSAMQEDIIYTA